MWVPRSGKACAWVLAMVFEKKSKVHVSGHLLPADFFEKKFKISSLVLELTNEIARTLPITIFQIIRRHLVIS